MSLNASQQRERRERARALGMCAQCGARPAPPDRLTCADCRRAAGERVRLGRLLARDVPCVIVTAAWARAAFKAKSSVLRRSPKTTFRGTAWLCVGDSIVATCVIADVAGSTARCAIEDVRPLATPIAGSASADILRRSRF